MKTTLQNMVMTAQTVQLGFVFFAHLLSNAPSFRPCFKHSLPGTSGDPPLLFFAPLFLAARLPAAPRYPGPVHYCRLSENSRTPRCHAACGIPTPAELGGTCGIPTPAELGGSDPLCSLVAPVFRIHTILQCERLVCNSAFQIKLGSTATVRLARVPRLK